MGFDKCIYPCTTLIIKYRAFSFPVTPNFPCSFTVNSLYLGLFYQVCFLSLWIYSTFLRIPYKWNHPGFTLFCLNSLSLSWAIPMPTHFQLFLLLYCSVVFRDVESHMKSHDDMATREFIYQFTAWWKLGLFQIVGHYE